MQSKSGNLMIRKLFFQLINQFNNGGQSNEKSK